MFSVEWHLNTQPFPTKQRTPEPQDTHRSTQECCVPVTIILACRPFHHKLSGNWQTFTHLSTHFFKFPISNEPPEISGSHFASSLPLHNLCTHLNPPRHRMRFCDSFHRRTRHRTIPRSNHLPIRPSCFWLSFPPKRQLLCCVHCRCVSPRRPPFYLSRHSFFTILSVVSGRRPLLQLSSFASPCRGSTTTVLLTPVTSSCTPLFSVGAFRTKGSRSLGSLLGMPPGFLTQCAVGCLHQVVVRHLNVDRSAFNNRNVPQR